MTNPTKIKLQIGTYTVEFVVMETTAPREYDGFGTLEIYSTPGFNHGSAVEARERKRIVLVDTEHKTWQVARYGSGLYTAEDCDALDTYVQNELLKRIRGTS